jgi:hypothetical protein
MGTTGLVDADRVAEGRPLLPPSPRGRWPPSKPLLSSFSTNVECSRRPFKSGAPRCTEALPTVSRQTSLVTPNPTGNTHVWTHRLMRLRSPSSLE